MTAQVVSADPSKLRVSLSLKALAPDPLRETIETLSWRDAAGDDELLPQVVEIVSVLRMEAGISGVEVGRQAEEKAVVAQVCRGCVWVLWSFVGAAVAALSTPLNAPLTKTNTLPLPKTTKKNQGPGAVPDQGGGRGRLHLGRALRARAAGAGRAHQARPRHDEEGAHARAQPRALECRVMMVM